METTKATERTHAILISFTTTPRPDGQHERYDTIARRALETIRKEFPTATLIDHTHK